MKDKKEIIKNNIEEFTILMSKLKQKKYEEYSKIKEMIYRNVKKEA